MNKRYKLIKEYPGSPSLNNIVEYKRNYYAGIEEWKNIRVAHSHVESNPEYWQLIGEESEMVKLLRKYFAETPKEQIQADWDAVKDLECDGPTVAEFLETLNSKDEDAEMSKFTNSQIGSIHWLNSILAQAKDIFTVMSDKRHEQYYEEYGKSMYPKIQEIIDYFKSHKNIL